MRRQTPVAQHIVQRGNNRQVCFESVRDFAAYAYWLHEAVDKFESSRREIYRTMFQRRVDAPLLTKVRDALNQGLVLGNERFKDDVEVILRRWVRLGRPGPLRKNKKKCRPADKRTDVDLTPMALS